MKKIIISAASAALLAAAGVSLAADDAFVGRYGGTGDGGSTEVTIKRQGAGYMLDIHVYGDMGCGGSFSAPARVLNPTTIVASKRVEGGDVCTLTMTRRGKSWSVSESGCYSTHGVSCGYDGSVTRTGPARTGDQRAGTAQAVDSVMGAYDAVGLDSGGPAGDLDFGDRPTRRPTAGPAWVDGYDSAWVFDTSGTRALYATGCAGSYQLNIALVGASGPEPDGEVNQPRGPWARAFAGVTTVTVRPLDRGGRPLATIVLRRESDGPGGGVRIRTSLTNAQAAALKASASIEATTGTTRLMFSGAGATKALNGLHCMQD